MYRKYAAAWAVSIGALVLLSGCPAQPAPAMLSAKQIFNITNGRAVGPVAVSSDGSLLAFSDGQNIFLLSLDQPGVPPIQVTSGAMAVAPSFLADGRLVFVTMDPLFPNQLQILTATPQTSLGTPPPGVFGTVTASDLGFAADTTIAPPTQFAVDSTGRFGTTTVNDQAFLFNFNDNPFQVMPLNTIFGMPVTNTILSPNLTQIAFTTSSGQVGVAPFSNGLVNPFGVMLVGEGTFPAFTSTGQLGFLGPAGLTLGNTLTGFNTFGFGASGLSPGLLTFSPVSNSFFTTDVTAATLMEGLLASTNPFSTGF